jgi:hypothetical protein
MVWIGLIWLRIGTSKRLLWTRWWTFGFHKMLGSFWVAAQLAASQEGLRFMCEWVSEWDRRQPARRNKAPRSVLTLCTARSAASAFWSVGLTVQARHEPKGSDSYAPLCHLNWCIRLNTVHIIFCVIRKLSQNKRIMGRCSWPSAYSILETARQISKKPRSCA